MVDIVLTGEQLQAMEFLKEKHKACVLNGSAGSGKTTVVSEYFKRNRLNERLTLAATTHKAAAVLSANLDTQAVTIHSFLGLKRKVIGNKIEFIYDPNKPTPQTDVLFIDEASMIDPKLLSHISDASENNGFRVVFIGDEKQLNPVNYTFSPIFNADYPVFTLQEIIRQDNDIIALSRNLNILAAKLDGECYEWIDPQEMDVSLLVDANGSDAAKFITWTNKVVSQMNNYVRGCIYGAEVTQIEQGEVILMNAPYKDIYRNNEEVKVESVRLSHVYYSKHSVPNPEIKSLLINDKMHIVTWDDKEKFNANVQFLLELAKAKQVSWFDYYAYRDSMGDYQYNHAITVHKAQGSTYDVAFVNVTEMMRNPNVAERDRLLYTAVTRAKYKNYLL